MDRNQPTSTNQPLAITRIQNILDSILESRRHFSPAHCQFWFHQGYTAPGTICSIVLDDRISQNGSTRPSKDTRSNWINCETFDRKGILFVSRGANRICASICVLESRPITGIRASGCGGLSFVVEQRALVAARGFLPRARHAI